MKPLFKYHLEVNMPDTDEVYKSWGVMPVGNTPILDGVYDPVSKALKLYINSQQEILQPVRMSDKKGNPIVEYRRIPEYYRIAIAEEDIPNFLELYVDNNFEFKEEASTTMNLIQEPVFSERREVVDDLNNTVKE
jgi:hypothetical protein